MKKLFSLALRTFDDLPILDGLIAENWAAKGIVTLTGNTPMVFAVNRDYQQAFVNAGEVVNVPKISAMTARRKARGGVFTAEQAKSTNVPVVMDQHIYARTFISNRDITASFDDLFARFGRPCIDSLSRTTEEIIIGKTMKTVVANRGVGKLGVAFTSDNAAAINQRFREANAGGFTRYAFINPKMETELLLQKLITEAAARGDNGNALTNATIGKILNTNFVPSSIMPYVTNDDDVTAELTNGTVVSTATKSTITITSAVTAPVAGGWIVLADEGAPHLISKVTNGGTANPTHYELEIQPPIDPLVTLTTAHAVKFTITGTVANITLAGTQYTAYPEGWTEEVGVSFAGSLPIPGQLVSFGTSLSLDGLGLPKNVYGALTTGADDQVTDRVFLSDNLSGALTVGSVVGKGPSGGYGIAMCPEAVTLVNRPLAVVPGAQFSAFMEDSGLSLNVTIAYDSDRGGYKLTYETLLGVTVTNPEMVYPLFD